MRKICFLSVLHRATDTRLFDLEAKSLVEAGHSVAIIGIHDFHEKINDIEIIPIARPSRNLFGFLKAAFDVYDLALKTHSMVYQFHDPELIFVGLLLRCRGKKVIYDVHEDYEQKILTRLEGPALLRKSIAKLWWLIEKVSSLAFDLIVVADSHIERKFLSEKTIVIPNFPRQEFWNSCNRTRSIDSEFRLIYVGTITRDRGIKETIKSLEYVKHQQVTFRIIGGTEDQELIDLFEGDPKVNWHGRVKWCALGSELANADAGIVLLQPVSAYLYYPGENIVKLWEYLSIGLPVLISNFPKLEKLCNEIGFGLAVDPTDPRQIAEAIDYLIDHPEERLRFGENGKRIVRSECNAEKKMKDLIQYYDRLFEDASSTNQKP